jgi:hypothetical protein
VPLPLKLPLRFDWLTMQLLKSNFRMPLWSMWQLMLRQKMR